MKITNEFVSHGGVQMVVNHFSKSTNCDMNFAIFLPSVAKIKPVPVVWYLSGLTCTHSNVMEKGEYRSTAEELGLAIICPDTSPRGENVPDEADNWQFGSGAGFYLDAKISPYDKNYNMYSYVVKELPEFVQENFNVNIKSQGIMGHSMGGHGAITIALKNNKIYSSCSAFAPISQPSTASWTKVAFEKYLGMNKKTWREYDSTCLIEDGYHFSEILIDQGKEDEFLDTGLRPHLLEKVCAQTKIKLSLNLRDGYDHSYYFVSSFMRSHLQYHHSKLSLNSPSVIL